MSTSPKRFRIAFSFAGEKRAFVAQVAAILADYFGEDENPNEDAILYDKFHESEFARNDLSIYLPNLYNRDSDLVVVVVCPNYDAKEWTGLEWLAIHNLLQQRRREEVMPCRFARAQVEGLFGGAGFIELDDKSPEQFAKLILERLALNEGKPKDHHAKILAAKLAKKVSPPDSPAAPVATPYAYFKALSDNFSTYENLGLPPAANAEGEKDVRIAIRELFVEPACTAARVSPEKFDAALLAGKNTAEALLPKLAGEERRFVLLADPGMGKSTLIQWLITTLAEEAPLPAAASGLRGAIPLPFILRDLVRHLPKDAKDWDWPALLKAFTSYHPRAADRPPLAAALTGDEANFRTLLASERAFFLIDGLDEIGDPAHRRALRDALWQGFEQYPKARWLVTSRWVGYDEAEVHEEKAEEIRGPIEMQVFANKLRDEIRADIASIANFSDGPIDQAKILSSFLGKGLGLRRANLLYLAPFDDLQQLTFARHWYLPRMGDVVGAEHAGRFVAAVQQNSAVRVIGRVPNLLYLLALLYRHRALLPHGRAHVYAAISEAYLGGMEFGIDAARGASGSTVGSIQAARRLQGGEQFKDKVRVLATIARHMQERRVAQGEKKQAEEKDDDGDEDKRNKGGAGEILVKREELERWLAPHFPGEGGCAALHAFIGYVAARSGLLLPRGEGLFGFAHLSFQEFYAACWLEEEFRRLLNAQARGSGGGFLLRAAAPEPRGSLTREGFAALAAQPAWREPLVFLVEKLSANADDTLTLIDWLFPQLAKPEPETKKGGMPPALMPIEAARLLAALSLDPQVALTTEQRQIIWEKLWHAHLAQQYDGDWHLAPALLAASEFQPQVWAALVPMQPKTLILTGCTGVTDLAPLKELAQLQKLSIEGCTGVTDLVPLQSLAQLQKLYLEGCTGVADLAPLQGLAKLQRLSIEGCTGVTDLVPLQSLAQLQLLLLSGCTGLADLAPLQRLTQLQLLFLNGCTGLSAESVEAFWKSHPNAKVLGP